MEYIIPDGIAGNKFSIGSSTGEITTNAILDREEQDHWVITGRNGTVWSKKILPWHRYIGHASCSFVYFGAESCDYL